MNTLTLLNLIVSELKKSPDYSSEEPDHIWCGVPNHNFGLSNQLCGVVYALVSEYSLKDHILRVNKTQVAQGRLEIMLWVIENAPKTYANAVRLLIQYEKENNAQTKI